MGNNTPMYVVVKPIRIIIFPSLMKKKSDLEAIISYKLNSSLIIIIKTKMTFLMIILNLNIFYA